MSKFKVQTPVIHLPSYTKYKIARAVLVKQLEGLGIMTFPQGITLDRFYYYTNLEGWGKIFHDLTFNSNLYKKDVFDCEDYALKAQTTCAERYGLNAFRLCIGDIPGGKHGFNIFYSEAGFMLWEPNSGFSCSGQPFEIGENDYKPEIVLI